MFSDLTTRALRSDAYDDHPFGLIGQTEQSELAGIAAINLIENGDRIARESWQNKKLTNLLRHAHARSKYWRQRMPSRMIGHGIMSYLPVQTRKDVATQVELEGSLAAADGRTSKLNYSSTGSTGAPVKVFICPENGSYNTKRSLAQFFIDNLSLEENRVQITPPTSIAKIEKRELTSSTTDSWVGPLSSIFRTGSNKRIIYRHDDDGRALFDELLKSPVGYLVSPSRYVERLIGYSGIDLIKKLGIKLWLHNSDYRNPAVVEALKEIGIPSLSNYSAGEVGPIAFECKKYQGHFHVAHTNAVVECDRQVTTSFDGVTVGRLLVTHLHSYATPIIRYDVGDFGELNSQCKCGHDGPTISHIYGRGKHFLRHPNGSLLPFYLSTRALQEVTAFKECRVMQRAIDTITVEISGRETIAADEEERLKSLIVKVTDPAFKVDIKPVQEIDWSGNPKRLFFSSSVA
jgi:phenylacetate-coenzyme A ligase PaaK-like adenylate-forming protein